MGERLPLAKELRAQPEAELQAQLEKSRQELWQIRAKAKDGSAQQTHHARRLRRQIARLLTVAREKTVAQEKNA